MQDLCAAIPAAKITCYEVACSSMARPTCPTRAHGPFALEGQMGPTPLTTYGPNTRSLTHNTRALHGVPGRACARVSQRTAGRGLGRRAQRAGRRTGRAAAGAAAAPGQLSSGGQRSCRQASGAAGSAAGQSRLLPAQAGPAAQGPQGVCMCAWAHVPFCALAAWPCSLHVHAWCGMQRVAGSSGRACTVASLRYRGALEDFVVGGTVLWGFVVRALL